MLENEHNLEQDLLSYMRTEIFYTVHRLLPADLKNLYLLESCEEININPFDETFKPISYHKGGLQLTDNIFFNWYAYHFMFVLKFELCFWF